MLPATYAHDKSFFSKPFEETKRQNVKKIWSITYKQQNDLVI